jgi:ABC-type dipeptide/oligopeptide/nickel transport system permease subunit
MALFVRGTGPTSCFGLIPGDLHLFGATEGFVHMFGTDFTGLDLFSRTHPCGAGVAVRVALVGVADVVRAGRGDRRRRRVFRRRGSTMW